MVTNRFTLLPFTAALLIGIATMGLSVYAINERQVGTLNVGHRGTRQAELVAPTVNPAVALLERLRLTFGDERGFIAAELLVPVAGIKALQQRAADLVKAMKGIETKLGDTTIAAEAPERVELRSDMKRLSALHDVNAEDLEQANKLATAEKNLVIPAADPDVSAAARAARGTGVSVGKDNSEDDPKRGFKSHREFMGTVLEAGRFGRVDARLKPLQQQATAGSDEHGTYSDPSANFLIPAAFSPDILAVQAEADPTAALTRKMPMTAPMVKVNARVDKDHSSSVSGGLRVYRHSETAAATGSRAATEQLTFQAEDLMGLAYATENQITDSPGSFVAMIADGFRDEFGAKTLQEKLRGVGAAGQYTGVLNAAALITVTKQAGQAADTIVVENIDAMASRLWRYTSDRTVYLANPTTRPSLRGLTRNVGTGGTTVNYFSETGGVERLDGRLIFFTEFASAIGDVGDLILVNWAEFIEGLYQPLQQAESIHVRFENHERAYKFWLRNCGQCWWSSVLTPKYGATLSPLVTLAAR